LHLSTSARCVHGVVGSLIGVACPCARLTWYINGTGTRNVTCLRTLCSAADVLRVRCAAFHVLTTKVSFFPPKLMLLGVAEVCEFGVLWIQLEEVGHKGEDGFSVEIQGL